jgi:type IV pilus assembly protein PilV
MNQRVSCAPDDGFTLIEIMIALVILSVGLLAVAAVQLTVIRGNALAKRLTTATAIAERKLEEIKNTTFATIQGEAASPVTVANLTFTRQVTVTPNGAPPTAKTVSVLVTWTAGSTTHTVPVTTVIAR